MAGFEDMKNNFPEMDGRRESRNLWFTLLDPTFPRARSPKFDAGDELNEQ